jgi:hypothetical protein
MSKTLEKQYLAEAEFKLSGLEYRLELDRQAGLTASKSLVREYYDTCEYIERIKAELGEVSNG